MGLSLNIRNLAVYIRPNLSTTNYLRNEKTQEDNGNQEMHKLHEECVK
jgi:hypothetical protein